MRVVFRSHLSMTVTGVLALLASQLPAQGNAMLYAPGSAQYRVTSQLSQTSEMMGEQQERHVTTMQLVTVEIGSGSRDTLHVSIVIDSARVEPAMPAGTERLLGVRLSGTMSPRGRIHDLQPPAEFSDDAEVQSVVLSMRNFLVGLPPSTATGAAWTDTTDSSVETTDLDMARRVIARSTLAGDTSYAGQRAHRILQNVDVSLSGTASGQGQTVLISGLGTGAATYYVTSSGMYLGSRSEQETTIEFSIGEMKMPLRQTMTATVERVR